MNRKSKKKNSLSKAEMNSGAFKVLKDENISLKKTLISTQDELERYRSQYHESDKKNGIYESMRKTIVFHEVIKFLSTGIIGSLSIYFFTEGMFLYASVTLLVAIVMHALIVYMDNKIFGKKNE